MCGAAALAEACALNEDELALSKCLRGDGYLLSHRFQSAFACYSAALKCASSTHLHNHVQTSFRSAESSRASLLQSIGASDLIVTEGLEAKLCDVFPDAAECSRAAVAALCGVSVENISVGLAGSVKVLDQGVSEVLAAVGADYGPLSCHTNLQAFALLILEW